jgi:predicted transcriptional regulator
LCGPIPVNFKILNHLVSIIGCRRVSLIFSKIAFAFNNTQIEHENKCWCALAKSELVKWSGVDIKTIQGYIKCLVQKGLILEKKFKYKGRNKSHFHITDYALEIIKTISDKTTIKNEKSQGQNSQPTQVTHTKIPLGKTPFPIRIRTEVDNNSENNITGRIEYSQYKQNSCNNPSEGDINHINSELTKRQRKFLKSSLERTYARKHFPLSSFKQTLAEMEYFILNQAQHKGIITFKHAVNRAMKILSDGNWHTPFGFHKFSCAGKTIAEKNKEREATWQAQKSEEIRALKGSPILEVVKQTQEKNKSIEAQKQAEHLIEKISHLKALEAIKSIDQRHLLNQAKNFMGRLYELLNQGLSREWLQASLLNIA